MAKRGFFEKATKKVKRGSKTVKVAPKHRANALKAKRTKKAREFVKKRPKRKERVELKRIPNSELPKGWFFDGSPKSGVYFYDRGLGNLQRIGLDVRTEKRDFSVNATIVSQTSISSARKRQKIKIGRSKSPFVANRMAINYMKRVNKGKLR